MTLQSPIDRARVALETYAQCEATAALIGEGVRNIRVGGGSGGGCGGDRSPLVLYWDVQCDTAGHVFTHEVLK